MRKGQYLYRKGQATWLRDSRPSVPRTPPPSPHHQRGRSTLARRTEIQLIRLHQPPQTSPPSSSSSFESRQSISTTNISPTSFAWKKRSGAVVAMMIPPWYYPIQGFYFFFRNTPRLWKHIAQFVAEVVAASVGLLVVLVLFTFGAQRRLALRLLPPWGATVGAIALVLLETAVAIVYMFQYRLQSAQRKLFVEVVALQGVKVERATEEERAWLREKVIPQLGGVQPISTKQVAKGRKPAGYLSQVLTEDTHPMMHYILTLPLNFVPVVGSVLFCFLNSFPTAVGLHQYYYTEMKGLSSEEFSAVVHARKVQYQQFGMVASALDLIPGLDIILVCTNAVGAALWAADMEKTGGSLKTKWGLNWYDKLHGMSYGTFGASSSGESPSHP